MKMKLKKYKLKGNKRLKDSINVFCNYCSKGLKHISNIKCYKKLNNFNFIDSKYNIHKNFLHK